jgi:ribonuclease P protein component
MTRAQTPATSPHRFTKLSRLRRKAEFTGVFNTAVRVQGRYLTLLLAPNRSGRLRLGIVASRKLGDAVRRNRAKRMIREAFRRSPQPLSRPGVDLVVIPRRELFDAPFSSLETDFRGAVARGVPRLPPADATR